MKAQASACWVCLFVFQSGFDFIFAYNSATNYTSYIYAPANGMHFGYSVSPHRIDGKLLMFVGAPKYSSRNETEAHEAKEGALYRCQLDFSKESYHPKLYSNCTKMSLKQNNRYGYLPDMALDSCSMENYKACGFQNSPDADFDWILTNRSGIWQVGKWRKTYQPRCPPRRIKCERISGPGSYSVNDKYLNADSNVFKKTDPGNVSKSYILESPIIEREKGMTQCLRFCYHAYSECIHCRRGLNVTLRELGINGVNKSAEKLFFTNGSNTGRHWNHTEINITAPYNGKYKIIFEATVYNNWRRKYRHSGISDIVLTDITVANLPCGAEKTNVDELENEQSVGMSIGTTKLSDNKILLATCAPLWQLNCGYAKEANGVCYQIQANSSDVTNVKKFAPIPQKCIRGEIDIIFLVDQSGSVNQCNFQKIKRWLRNIIRGFSLGISEQDVAVVVYSNEKNTRAVIRFGFANYSNSGEMKMRGMMEVLTELPYEGGLTYTGTAFRKANEMLFGPNARKNVKKIIILLTDGATTKKNHDVLKEQTKYSRDRNVTILAVGVGRYNKSELISIAGSERNFFAVKKFSELEKVRDKLRSSVSVGSLESAKTSGNQTNDKNHQCQVGFSLSFSNKSLLMGSPGCYDQQGNIISHHMIKPTNSSISNHSSSNNTSDEHMDEENFLESDIEKEFNIPSFRQVKEALNGSFPQSYFGYDTTVGHFFGANKKEYIASSAPRYNKTGCVMIYLSEIYHAYHHSVLLYGHQLGEYFGASMLSQDVNSDGFDDLFVGAPLHTSKQPDEGRVYVYYGKTTLSKEPDLILKGDRKAFSRFGWKIFSIGDIDRDGYQDIAVSAIMEEGVGSVYLYHGFSKGLNHKMSQKISANHIYPMPSYKLKGFGESVNGNVDIDQNGFPDLIISAPKLDTLSVFFSRPVVYANVTLTCDDVIDASNCNARHKCFSCTMCFSQNGLVFVDNVVMEYNLLVDENRKRATILKTGFESVTASLDLLKTPSCSSYEISMRQSIRNEMSQVQVSLHYNLQSPSKVKTRSKRFADNSTSQNIKNSILEPTLYNKDTKLKIFSVSFPNLCQNKSDCRADLSLKMSLVDENGKNISEILIDSVKKIKLKIEITNRGPEEAHDANLYINYPMGLSFSTGYHSKKRQLYLEEDQQTDPQLLSNRIKRKFNIIPSNWDYKKKGSKLDQVLYFTPIFDPYTTTNISFYGNITTLSTDNTTKNNLASVNVKVLYKSKVNVDGRSSPPICQLDINKTSDISTLAKLKNASKPVFHFYEVLNFGQINLKKTVVNISWPSGLKLDNYNYNLLYIRSIKCTGLEGQCKCKQNSVDKYGIFTGNINNNDQIYRQPLKDLSATSLEKDSVQYDTILCRISNFSIGRSFTVKIEAIPYPPTFIKFTSSFWVQSKISVYLPDTKSIGIQQFGTREIETEIIGNRDSAKRTNGDLSNVTQMPLWVYIFSVVGAIILLILILLVLRALGFFKSKYADKKREAEEEMNWDENAPLNS